MAFQVSIRPHVQKMTPYVPGKPVEELERELGIAGAAKLASNENPLGPSLRVLEAIREAAGQIHRYPDSAAFYLKRDLAKHLNVGVDRFLVGHGSNELLVLLAQSVLAPGDELIYAWPSFVVYPIAAQLCEAVGRAVPLKDGAHDLPAFTQVLGPKTKLVYICNPNNPTGTSISLLAVEAFLKICPPTVLVVLDEAYYEYVDEKTYFESTRLLEKYSNLVILRTFSKIYGLAGLRVGYGMADPAMVAALERIRQPFNVNRLALAAAQAALQDQAHVEKVRQLNREMREKIKTGLKRLGVVSLPSQTNFIYFQMADAALVYEKLLRAGVIVRPIGPEALRVTTGTEVESEKFLIELEKIIGSKG
ncbi:MAG: histidinol-phosphate transaminase [bacterium]